MASDPAAKHCLDPSDFDRVARCLEPDSGLELLERLRNAESERRRLRESLDVQATHIEIEQREHEETKGYRQHAEQQRDSARQVLSWLEDRFKSMWDDDEDWDTGDVQEALDRITSALE